MKSKRSVATLIALAVVCGSMAIGASAAPAQTGDAVRIGLEGPLSGDQKSIGIGMLDGARLAAAELNARGGLLGRKVEIVPIDDAADPATGVKAANTAIGKGLDGVVGPYNSGVGAETLPLYIAAGVVPIRLTSADATAGLGFTLQPMTSQIAPVAADALTKWAQAKSVAIIYDSTALYTQSVSSQLKALLEQADVTITAYQPIDPGAKSYADVVRTVAAAKPDVIYAGTYYPEGGLIAKAMYQQKVSSKCLADYGSYDSAFVPTAGKAAAKNCPVVGVPAPNDFVDSASHIAAYRRRFGRAPGTWSPYAYDSLNLFAYGVRRTGGFEAGALTKELGTVNGWSGWTGYVAIEPSTGNRQPATVVVTSTNLKGDLHVDPSWARVVGADTQ
ncbi:MAG TPA: branched-chain amino acid ABC transporter substrate-binding protein [Acidimicrobiia bacterium]|nr:branched-chain amino acid ABC transporter substrate-binding protein [Acidimicrobiia bacterium]